MLFTLYMNSCVLWNWSETVKETHCMPLKEFL